MIKINLDDEETIKVITENLSYENILVHEIPQALLDEINTSSNEKNLARVINYLEQEQHNKIQDPLGNLLYYEPGNTETMTSYALHLIAGKDAAEKKDLLAVRDIRVLGVMLSKQTIEQPLAIITENSGRKVYVAIYKGIVLNVANSIVIGVEEGQNGRIITVFITGRKTDKKAALRELRNRLSGKNTKKVLYISDGLYGHPQPTTEQQAS